MIKYLKNYRKIGNKKNNDVNANVIQLERSNNKYYILLYVYKQNTNDQKLYAKSQRSECSMDSTHQ